jgi:hypothetical protein
MNDERIASFRQRLPREAGTALYREIEAVCLGRREERGGHADWARLCEEAGLVTLAFREWQLALRDEPTHEEAAWRLAQSYRERGDLSRAARLLEGLLARQPARQEWLAALVDVLRDDGALALARTALERAVAAGLAPAVATALSARLAPVAEDSPPAGEPSAPGDADLVRFQALFSGREDTHARQWSRPGGETGYTPVREPLTPAVVRNHLLGTFTVGVYPIRLDGTCTFFALDLDISRAALERASAEPAVARQLRDAVRGEGLRLLGVLRELGPGPLFEDSGYKGRHYWVFLEQPETAEVLHRLGRLLLSRLSAGLAEGLHLEFFPKQAGLKGQGLGNLIKLPLGTHRRTGRRALLLDDDGRPLADPFDALRRVQRLSREVLYRLIERLAGEGSVTPPPATAAEASPVPATPGPPPPQPGPAWTEADFEADPAMRHLLAHCPVLAELKRTVDQHRRLSHEEQLVLIHTLGHLPAGPQAVNYLLSRCLDVGAEKLLKSQLRGHPVSCPSIRKKIGHITRKVACNCTFEQAPDRYPTPVLHLLGLPQRPAAPAAAGDAPQALALRFGALTRKRDEVQRDWDEMRRALVAMLRALPERTIVCPGGRYQLVEEQGVEELCWYDEASAQAQG